jgi:putative transposase
MPHHVTQRGNRRQPVFFCDSDYEYYLQLTTGYCRRFGVEVWAYCLMPNHVHLVLVPREAEALARTVAEVHRRYTCRINEREGWTGYLWQGRFASSVMDGPHTLAAVRYVELNPVRARLVARASEYRWSSARAHLDGRDDMLVRVEPMLSAVGDWSEYLAQDGAEPEADELRRHVKTGRPLGSSTFIASIESLLGRPLQKRKPGPKSSSHSSEVKTQAELSIVSP